MLYIFILAISDYNFLFQLYIPNKGISKKYRQHSHLQVVNNYVFKKIGKETKYIQTSRFSKNEMKNHKLEFFYV